MNIFKRLFCKHPRQTHYGCDLVRQNDGSWITSHTWLCLNCGKKMKTKRKDKKRMGDKKKRKWIKTIMKFQRPLYGSDLVLMYNEDRSIMGQQPMDQMFEYIFGDKYKVYCECKYDENSGYLQIGKQVKANW